MDPMEGDDAARLFFGARVEAAWPKCFPDARILAEESRHITLAFIGQDSISRLLPLLKTAPIPAFRISPAGIGNKLIFLPPEKSRVVSLGVEWMKHSDDIERYQKTLSNWLQAQGYSLDARPFLPHITIARSPFDKQKWQDWFAPLPFFVKSIQLYQSLGNLCYESLWEIPLTAPFVELEHTADIAFIVKGRSPQEIHSNAQVALAFKFPSLLRFFTNDLQNSLEEIVISLNELVSRTDTQIGCPFKAVSFHGKIEIDAQNVLLWEMIVDV